jgi:hypothetical protein
MIVGPMSAGRALRSVASAYGLSDGRLSAVVWSAKLVGVSVLVVCGIPGSGKSTFCRWLVSTQWVWVDTDEVFRSPLADPVVYEVLGRLPVDVDRLVGHLGARADNVVMEWGFQPLAYMDAIERLVTANVSAWWFDGDREAARRAYESRHHGDQAAMAALDLQMDRIELRWQRIEAAFHDRILITVGPGPRHLAADAMFEAVVAATLARPAEDLGVRAGKPNPRAEPSPLPHPRGTLEA